MTIQRVSVSRPQPLAARPVVARTAAAANVTTTPAPAPAPAKPGFKQKLITWAMPKLHDFLAAHPAANRFAANLTGPFVKQRFNGPAKPGAPTPPAPLQAATIEQARQIMAANFKPAAGKVIVGIAGGGNETVHAFVVSGVTPDGHVKITQALAQYGDKPEDYKGLGGMIRKFLDKKLGNEPKQMQGVVEMDWSEYAKQYNRNTVVLTELDADPAKVQAALKDLKGLVGRPYDQTMLGSDPATPATVSQMYCTEISSWFVNTLRPGTIKPSFVSGYPVYQVADHMKAMDVNGGPLKVLYNGENRLDIKNANPFPKAS